MYFFHITSRNSSTKVACEISRTSCKRVCAREKGNAATWDIEKDRNLMGDLSSCEYLRRWWISRGFIVSENRVKIGKSENRGNQKIDDVIKKSENQKIDDVIKKSENQKIDDVIKKSENLKNLKKSINFKNLKNLKKIEKSVNFGNREI